MMKKILFALVTLFFAINTQAQEPVEGKQYESLNLPRTAQPEVIEFFSFYCPHCYNFEIQYKIPAQIKATLPQEATLKQYHVDFMGRQSENLTRAWALAMALAVEEQVKEPLYAAAQANTLKSMNDIRQIFIKSGITAEQFDSGINSFVVNALVNKQKNLREQFQVNGVPDFYVNGKYRINPNGLSQHNFISDYVETVKILLQK